MRVRDCELTSPVILDPAASLSAAERLVALHDARHAVVVERGRLVGVVSRRALGAAHPSAATSLTMGEIGGRLARAAVADVMVRDPLIVNPTTPLAEAVRLMRDARANVLVICDQDQVVGLLTATELLRVLDRLAFPDGSE
jgi:CBS domain-containing protein